MLAAEPTGASYMSSEFQTEQAALEFTSGRVDWAVVGARDAPTGHRARVRRRREILQSQVNNSRSQVHLCMEPCEACDHTVKVQGPSRSIPGSQKPKTCYGIVLHPRPFRCRRVANDNEVLSHAVRKSGESSRPKTTKKCAVQLLESRSWGAIRSTNQTRGISSRPCMVTRAT